MNNEELVYQINVHDDGTREFLLNEKPLQFINPSLVEVGSVVWFDQGLNSRYGVVCEVRKGSFIYYDVNDGTMDKPLEEIAEFQVYKVQTKDGTIHDLSN